MGTWRIGCLGDEADGPEGRQPPRTAVHPSASCAQVPRADAIDWPLPQRFSHQFDAFLETATVVEDLQRSERFP
jgi:hypothetical protein